jgi:hypothetical protein
MPESADREEIRFRIRVTGTNNPQQDNADLRAWLEREPWLARRPYDWEAEPRPDAADTSGRGDMAVGIDDLILVVVGAAAAELAKGMGIALREWLRRRREERAAGEAPAVAADEGDGRLRQIDVSPAAEGGSASEG